ncbi:hypothetical protein [Spongiimicrobium salis]|uniref:hypothetical protein n=1 Tax=Spongiimicrobium salis TaxID=1667022 RepID=UPI00374D316B
MFKNIKTISGVKSLSKSEQKEILGGSFGHGFGCNQPILAQCFDDSDCPCNRRCGVTVDGGPQGPIFFADVCEFN